MAIRKSTMQEQVAQGQLYQHPRTSPRSGDRFGVRPPDPKDYLRAELATVFRNLERALAIYAVPTVDDDGSMPVEALEIATVECQHGSP